MKICVISLCVVVFFLERTLPSYLPLKLNRKYKMNSVPGCVTSDVDFSG